VQSFQKPSCTQSWTVLYNVIWWTEKKRKDNGNSGGRRVFNGKMNVKFTTANFSVFQTLMECGEEGLASELPNGEKRPCVTCKHRKCVTLFPPDNNGTQWRQCCDCVKKSRARETRDGKAIPEGQQICKSCRGIYSIERFGGKQTCPDCLVTKRQKKEARKQADPRPGFKHCSSGTQCRTERFADGKATCEDHLKRKALTDGERRARRKSEWDPDALRDSDFVEFLATPLEEDEFPSAELDQEPNPAKLASCEASRAQGAAVEEAVTGVYIRMLFI